ncbi:hypothetical protein GGR52DRAFT_263957 [Hypoxylon sp. FL1284]|nr:hypothetical protein GGR52DRAFT_263957 [Hypoxylon sp. FL1284]
MLGLLLHAVLSLCRLPARFTCVFWQGRGKTYRCTTRLALASGPEIYISSFVREAVFGFDRVSTAGIASLLTLRQDPSRLHKKKSNIASIQTYFGQDVFIFPS